MGVLNFLGLSDLFRRAPSIHDAAALAELIDRNAAFLAQKGLYEYSRARAGHYAKVLFNEPTFLQAAEASSWRAYPLGLAMVAEVVDSVLRPGREVSPRHLSALSELVLSVFDRHPHPAALPESEWRDLRAELARRLALIGLHAPKRAIDVPEPFVHAYFALMPIHEKLRGSDFPTIHNYLRVTLCNIHDELTKRMDAPAIRAALVSAVESSTGAAVGRD